VEYIQFTNLLLENKHLSEILEGIVKEDWRLSLPAELPVSAIMTTFSENVCRTTFMIAVRSLFVRYIETGAPLEINIDYKLKSSMKVLLDSNVEDDSCRVSELLKEIHAAVRQVSTIMDGSFIRFNQSSIGELYYRKQKQRKSRLPNIEIVI